MAVKNIIFDLGGVLLDIDYRLTEKAFIGLGCHNFDEIYSQARQSSLFDDFEEGKIDENAFFYKLNALSGLNASFKDVKDAWNAMLIGFPEKNYTLLQDLKNKYNLFLLSNTNQTHVNAFEKLIEKVCPMPEFEGAFNKVYYSNFIGLRKPNATPFLKILLENNLSAEETVFIDDSIQHVKGAAKTGIKAHWLEKPKTTETFLRELNLL
ncbi:MAG TPA: HAD family phosphatase [Bacteroidia bacterium]|jgi:FMN phosphatase YigB (HAD superfamily)|nr:HAD family phosphatase [Bacteroidia bacterium]